jgi:hypothetical protein
MICLQEKLDIGRKGHDTAGRSSEAELSTDEPSRISILLHCPHFLALVRWGREALAFLEAMLRRKKFPALHPCDLMNSVAGSHVRRDSAATPW